MTDLLPEAWLMDRSWRELAACRGMGPDLFFGNDPADALAVCARCPVTLECAQAGAGEEIGVWGGRQLGGRKVVRRRNQRAAATADAEIRGERRPHPENLRQVPQPDGRRHGTLSCYRSGCSCLLCRRAERAHRARYRKRSA